MSLLSRTPSRNEVVSLEPEELGAVLLIRVRNAQANEKWAARQAQAFPSPDRPLPTGVQLTELLSAFSNLEARLFEVFHRASNVTRAVCEAWAWLISVNLIVARPDGSGRFILTKRGLSLPTEEAVIDHRDNGVLEVGLLHPRIAGEVYSLFTRRHLDTAVFHAFREVEFVLREAVSTDPKRTGKEVVRDAFNPNTGILRNTDPEIPDSEREGEFQLFNGAIGTHKKNSGSHRRMPLSRAETARLVLFASHLLFVVEERRARIAAEG